MTTSSLRKAALTFGLLGALSGCAGDGQVPLDQDADGVVDDEDCAPNDATIFPGAAELCDGVDQDCDGDVDEDAIDMAEWFVDADGDMFGDPASPKPFCNAPAGFVGNGSDCDDTNPSVFPNAPEVCGDGIINACGELDSECRLDGVIMISEGDMLGNVQASRCWHFVDVDGDGVIDASCGNASWVKGPIVEGPMRPQWLLQRSLVGRTAIADVDGDGQADLANWPPDVDEIDVYYGPLSTELTGRSENRLSFQLGWVPAMRIMPDGGLAISVSSPDTAEVYLSRTPFDESSDLVSSAEWRLLMEPQPVRVVFDLNDDGVSDVLYGLSGGQHSFSGRPGFRNAGDAFWEFSAGVLPLIGRELMVSTQSDVPQRLVTQSHDRSTGAVKTTLHVYDGNTWMDGDPCYYPVGLIDINADGFDDLVMKDSCTATLLVAWFGPIASAVDADNPDLKVVSDVEEGKQLSVDGMLQAVDLDGDNLPELIMGFSKTVGGQNVESVIIRGVRP